MLSLHTKVNIVPVIAKADTLTQVELKELKKTVQGQIEQHGICVFTPAVDEEDPSSLSDHVQIVESMPFAVVGSSHIIDVGGKSARGRVYPWGVVEGEQGKCVWQEGSVVGGGVYHASISQPASALFLLFLLYLVSCFSADLFVLYMTLGLLGPSIH